MQSATTFNKPSIIICVAQLVGYEAKLRELQAGMEEEGVPYTIQEGTASDAVMLGYQGAQLSPLGVGIGIDAASLCIHYQKLPEDQPLFMLDGQGTLAEWRNFGYNAARLVKGLPFKQIARQEESAAADELTRLYENVRKIILKVLQESAQGHGEVNTWSKMP